MERTPSGPVEPGGLTRRGALERIRAGALCTLGLGAAGFAAFGPRGAKEQSDGKVVLDYWEKWSGHEGRAMRRVVDEFNASQNRIVVRYLITAGIDQKTLISVAGGDPPDVVGLWNYNVPLYAETEAILPLEDLAAPFGVRLENYAPGFRAVMEHPDRTGRTRMWATINTGGTLALYYNKALYREAGLDPERPPRTIEELDEYDRKLTKIGADGRIERAGFLHTEPGWWSWIWGYHFGGKLMDEATDRSLADSAENVAAYAWMQGYSERLGVNAVKAFRSGFATEYDSPRNAFVSGRVAMVVQGPWLANVIKVHGEDRGNPVDYGVTPFPVIGAMYDEKAPVGLIDCDILVIPKGVKRPEACMEFIAYTQRQEVVEYLSREHYKNSPLAASSEEFLRTHPNRGVRVHDAIAQSTRSFLCPRTRTWPQFKDEFDAAMQRMWGLERSAKEELATVRGKTQGVLDRAAGQKKRRGYG
jgi:ABC-type glycerol-3-phosphate transport system substrate-binding protein